LEIRPVLSKIIQLNTVARNIIRYCNYLFLNLPLRNLKKRFKGSQKTATKKERIVSKIPVIIATIPPPKPGPI